jgi:hypothetical protein
MARRIPRSRSFCLECKLRNDPAVESRCQLSGVQPPFAARSSPFVRLADALEVLIELSPRVCQGHHLQQGARYFNWRRARNSLCPEVTLLEEGSAGKHPFAFLTLFIVTLLQAVKIFGFEGLLWTKVWAGCFLGSYTVLAFANFSLPKMEKRASLHDGYRRSIINRQLYYCCDLAWRH